MNYVETWKLGTFNGQLSGEIAIDNGVKEGDLLAPTIFSISFAALLTRTFKDCDPGIPLRFRTSGNVFNLRRFNTKSEIFVEDDAIFLARRQTDIQHIMDHFSRLCKAFGLNNSLKKTKVMFTPAPSESYIEPNITVNGTRLDVVDTFVYFGSTVSRDVPLDTEIYYRISKASVAFGKLEKRVWAARDITINTKIGVYRTCVIMVLLYLTETWTTRKGHVNASIKNVSDVYWLSNGRLTHPMQLCLEKLSAQTLNPSLC